MRRHTFSTNLRTPQKRITRWILLVGGIFLIISQGYNYWLSRDEIYLPGFVIGGWALIQALFFRYFMIRTELTIDDQFICYHQFKTFFKSEKTITVLCRDIQLIILSNYRLILILKKAIKQKFTLPHYNRSRFSSIEGRFKRWASENGIALKVKRRWKEAK